jgi:hypothetical protein
MATYVGKRRRPEPTLRDVIEGRYKVPEWQKILLTLIVVGFFLSLALLIRLGV